MMQGKYSKYFLHELEPERRQKGFGKVPQTIVFTDRDIIEGSLHFWALWISSLPWPEHGPHTHRDPELIITVGSDPENPWDLGCVVDGYLGIEMEPHPNVQSSVIFIPGGFVHGPARYRDFRRPFIMMQAQYAPKLTEKSYKTLVPEEARDKMVFFDVDGTQTDEEFERQRERRIEGPASTGETTAEATVSGSAQEMGRVAGDLYRHYCLEELPVEQRRRKFGRLPETSVFVDDDIIKGSHHFWAVWVRSLPWSEHGPHANNDSELLAFLGSDPDNPQDLGCEVEFCMGPEMERHVFTESTAVFVPANLVHGPIRYRNLKRPFIFVQWYHGPRLTERPFEDLVPEEERGRLMFFRLNGTETDEELLRQMPGLWKV